MALEASEEGAAAMSFPAKWRGRRWRRRRDALARASEAAAGRMVEAVARARILEDGRIDAGASERLDSALVVFLDAAAALREHDPSAPPTDPLIDQLGVEFVEAVRARVRVRNWERRNNG